VNIFNKAIACMDATYSNSPTDSLDNSDILQEIDGLVMEFRRRFEIPADVEIGNADAVENDYENWRKEYDALEVKIFEICWSHMKYLMTDCGLGDIAREVFANDILDTPMSWDVKEKALKDVAPKA
jgi:hypothetical protein